MQLNTPREAFLQRLQLAASFAPNRSPRPIFQDVLLEVDDGGVRLLATDGEVSCRTRLNVEGLSGSGRVALPAATLLSAVRALPSAELSIRESGNLHEISGESTTFKLHGEDADLFPAIPGLDAGGKASVRVPLAAFLDLCDRASFAAARDMGRYAFHGVLLELGPEEIVIVSTDGRRLARASMRCSTGLTETCSSIVPVRGLDQLRRAASDASGELTIDVRDNQIGFGLAETEVIVLLVEGEFPDYRAVLPKESDTPCRAAIGRSAFVEAISRAAVTAGEEARAVELQFSAGRLAVCSRQDGLGECRSEIGVEYDGEEVKIRFNPEFLGDYLKTVSEDQVDFAFKNRASAGVFRGSGDSIYVVMPITS